ELVVGEEDVLRAQALERADLLEHHRDGLVPLGAAEEVDDVAELAVEGAAPGRLYGAEVVLGDAVRDALPLGRRDGAEVGLLDLHVLALRLAALPVGEETGPGDLGLVDEDGVDEALGLVGGGRDAGAAGDDEGAPSPEEPGQRLDAAVDE